MKTDVVQYMKCRCKRHRCGWSHTAVRHLDGMYIHVYCQCYYCFNNRRYSKAVMNNKHEPQWAENHFSTWWKHDEQTVTSSHLWSPSNSSQSWWSHCCNVLEIIQIFASFLSFSRVYTLVIGWGESHADKRTVRRIKSEKIVWLFPFKLIEFCFSCICTYAHGSFLFVFLFVS